ncbi:MAG TPA: cbb3-type cytochrome c oxidase subunit I [Gammaproteobacteria bacterium]|nr:cbb3-type cytochrome c oxidase subunit I [Gammaproteobacteria bacterium]
MNENFGEDTQYRRYILWFITACVIYSIIGFSWGVVVGMLPKLREFINHRPHAHLIMLGHGHLNLLGWVEMAIFAAVYYIVPRIVRRNIYSMRLVNIHFWIHNLGLLGMVLSFVMAGSLGGLASETMDIDEVNKIVRPFMILVGMFGSLVLLSNLIWAYNLFRTARGWSEPQSVKP